MRAVSICSLVCVVFMAMPSGASAQSQPSDPEADSPSGVVYELPVDRARKDAAPRRGSSRRGDGDGNSGSGEGVSGSPGGGSGSPGDGSGSSPSGTAGGSSADDVAAAAGEELSIRSENNFGTSSRVPGAGARKGAKRGERGEEAWEGSGAGAVDSLGRLAPASAAGATDGPSDTVVFLLLGALLAVGAGVGVVAGRRAARDQRS